MIKCESITVDKCLVHPENLAGQVEYHEKHIRLQE